jgi:hypothetical protein
VCVHKCGKGRGVKVELMGLQPAAGRNNDDLREAMSNMKVCIVCLCVCVCVCVCVRRPMSGGGSGNGPGEREREMR